MYSVYKEQYRFLLSRYKRPIESPILLRFVDIYFSEDSVDTFRLNIERVFGKPLVMWSEKVDDVTQKWFRSNTGCLLYHIKLSSPDLANLVCELSEFMDGAAPGHVKELKRQNMGLKSRNICIKSIRTSTERLSLAMTGASFSRRPTFRSTISACLGSNM